MKKRPIIILAPMECEYTAILSRMKNVNKKVIGNFTFSEGEIGNASVVAVNCLVGEVNSAAATMLSIREYSPKCVICQGTAGSHTEKLSVNDIVLCETSVETASCFTPHRDEGEGVKTEDWDFPGVEMLINGKPERVREMRSDESLLKIAEKVNYSKGKVVRGKIGSADFWNREIDRIKFFRDKIGTLGEEMENFASAQVCTMMGVPFLGVRVISNGELDGTEFDPESAVNCQNFCCDIIEAIDKEKAE